MKVFAITALATLWLPVGNPNFPTLAVNLVPADTTSGAVPPRDIVSQADLMHRLEIMPFRRAESFDLSSLLSRESPRFARKNELRPNRFLRGFDTRRGPLFNRY